MANTITFSRIAACIVLLFCPVFSPAFYVFYIAAGLSDMLDGFVARQTDTVSKLGTRLDTIADFVFVPVHSVMNKVAGALLFLLPLTIPAVPLKYSVIVVCAVATFAAIQEGHLIRTGRE